MLTLTADECRVLGVLVEKALTTPAQYPLSMNALTTGCSQKNNRHPVLDYTEERVFDAVDSLRRKSLVHEVMLSGSRVSKFRHMAREILKVETPQLVVLAELMLRGPQTAGELRTNASRMHPIDSLDALHAILKSLMTLPEPMVRELPGQRAKRFAQLICPTLHALDELDTDTGSASLSHASTRPAATAHIPDPTLTHRLDRLEAEVATLRDALRAAGIL